MLKFFRQPQDRLTQGDRFRRWLGCLRHVLRPPSSARRQDHMHCGDARGTHQYRKQLRLRLPTVAIRVK